ncbi:MAG: cache domain-containing protein [Nostocoides sp.]
MNTKHVSKPARTSGSLRALRASMQEVIKGLGSRTSALLAAAREDLSACLETETRDFPAVQRCAREALADGRPAILGMGFIGAAPSSGHRAVHWWYRPVGGRPSEQLEATSNPQLMGFYDVETTPWWQGAVTSSGLFVSGPYVDVSGTNAYILTGSRAVKLHKRFHGVVSLDIEVGALQDLWQRDLIRAENPTSVVDVEGSVIATNSGEILGGVIDPTDPSVLSRTSVPKTPWMLVQH